MAKGTTTRMDNRMADQLEQVAKREERTKSQQIRHYVRQGLRRDGYIGEAESVTAET